MVKKGFTLIELMLVVTIITILASVVVVSLYNSAQRKSAIVSYKTTMSSVYKAVEGCVGSGGLASSGAIGANICNIGLDSYPQIEAKCNISTPSYLISPSPASDLDSWEITTISGGSYWDCRGCRLICSVGGCVEAVGSDCD